MTDERARLRKSFINDLCKYGAANKIEHCKDCEIKEDCHLRPIINKLMELGYTDSIGTSAFIAELAAFDLKCKGLEYDNAALCNEADTNAANAIQAKLHADELEVILFAVIRNSMVMPVGLRLGKSKREITEMTFATIEEIKKAIDYDAVKKLMEGKDE